MPDSSVDDCRALWNWISCVLLGLWIISIGCSENREPDNPYLGNMADFSYSGQVTPGSTISRVNANGRMVSIGEFEGRFVWSDYAAPWCEPCVTQAQEIQRIEKRFGDKVIFLTVMTSVSPGNPKEVPDQQAARAWAQRFSLDPERVVAATNLFGWTVPTHILYSPQGQTLYRSKGYLPGDQIMNILSAYMRDWEEWSQSGRTASWMKAS